MDTTVLVLNQNYVPLNICEVRRAVILLLLDKAHTVEEGDGELRTTTTKFGIPAVIRLNRMVSQPQFIRRLSRREVFWRDEFTCQYCGDTTSSLTLDHVIPRVRGGSHTWDNVVTACTACNHRKAHRSPGDIGMVLKKLPQAPKSNPYYHLMKRDLPEQWRLYLPWLNTKRNRKGGTTVVVAEAPETQA